MLSEIVLHFRLSVAKFAEMRFIGKLKSHSHAPMPSVAQIEKKEVITKAQQTSSEFTLKDIEQHPDLLLIIHGVVYNVTKFINEHPGGDEVLRELAGNDATEAFEDIGHSDGARTQLEKFRIGTFNTYDARVEAVQKVLAGMYTTDRIEQAKVADECYHPKAIFMDPMITAKSIRQIKVFETDSGEL
jgi:cytochrome b involved in lipid metabolism